MMLEAPVLPSATDATAVAAAASSALGVGSVNALPTGRSAQTEAPGDAMYGWVMFVAFIAAVLGISCAVAVLALIGSWVMLGVAMAVHVVVTATMMKLVLGAFGSEEHAYPDMHQAQAASRAAIARRGSPVAAPRSGLAVEV